MEAYYTIQTPGHHSALFSELHVLQKQGVLCDVILAAEDGEVMAHKVVLMAASKYFREKLSPIVSPVPSRICLKGISVVELANLVKYIYTGKLLVAKETMDVTLEVSEILELNGVTQGYKDIVEYERMKKVGELMAQGSQSASPVGNLSTPDRLSSPVPTNMIHAVSQVPTSTATSYAQVLSSKVSTSSTSNSQSGSFPSPVPTSQTMADTSPVPFSLSQAAVPDSITNPTMIGKSVTVSTTSPAPHRTATPTAPNPPPATGQSDDTQPVQPQEIRVTELCEDGSTITYTLDQSSEYPFEGNPYDQQYMDVSVGTKGQVLPATSTSAAAAVSTANVPPLQKMAYAKPDQAALDEQAQHQDLLAVAIETLSGSAPAVRPQEQILPTVIQEIETETTPLQQEQEALVAKQNGKIESKIVTLNAGTVANELGGKTSVYTVALDPSSIKQPLLMPRVLRKKTEKEKQAEMIAKMYRQKKKELRKRVSQAPPNDAYKDVMENSITTEVDLVHEKGRKMPRILLRSASPKGRLALTDKQQHILIHRSQDGSVTTTKVPETSGESEGETAEDKGEFGQVVNFDSDTEADSGDKNSGKKAVESLVAAATKMKPTGTTAPLPAATVHAAIEGRTGRERKTMDTSVGSCKKVESSSKKTVFIDEHGNVLDVQTDSAITSARQNNKEAAGTKQTGNSITDAELEGTPVKENKGDDQEHIEHLRSSAAKRKGKVPRRLPLPENEEIPKSEPKVSTSTVRTRQDSKTETSGNSGRITRSKSSISEDTAPEDKQETAEVKQSSKDSQVSKIGVSSDKSTTPKKTLIIEKKNTSPSVRLFRLSEAEILKNTSPKPASDAKMQIKTSAKEASGVIEMEIEEYYGKPGNSNVESATVPASSVPCSIQNSSEDEVEDDMGDLEEIDLDMAEETGKNKSRTETTNTDAKDMPKKVDIGKKNNVQTTTTTKIMPDVGDAPKEKDNAAVSKGANDGNLSRGTKRKQPDNGEATPSKMLTRTRTRATSATLKNAEEIKSEKPEVVLESPEKWADASSKVSVKQEPIDVETEHDCTECGEIFKAGFDLAAHQLQRHNMPLPKVCFSYRCPVCDFTEAQYKTVDEHMAKHGGMHVPCIKCDKMFKTYAEMKKHMVAHSEKRHKCPHCDFVSNVIACVNVHVKLKHSDDLEVTKCLFCNYMTPLPGNLRKHYTTAHNLIVVTKQSLENRKKYRDYEEGALVTLDGRLFDPEVMPVPKMSQRHFKEVKKIVVKKLGKRGDKAEKDEAGENKTSETDKNSSSDTDKQPSAIEKPLSGAFKNEDQVLTIKRKSRKPALSKLPMEEFTKELLKRHNEFLKQPEKPLTFMSHSLAIATEHPSFPQASPSVRRTKADKIYYSVRPQLRFQDLTAAQDYINGVGTSDVPSAVNEVEVVQESPVNMDSENNVQTVLSISDQHDSDEQQMIVVTRNGQETVMHPKDFYKALVEKGDNEETRETIEMINQLLAAGQEIQIQEKSVEIQNI